MSAARVLLHVCLTLLLCAARPAAAAEGTPRSADTRDVMMEQALREAAIAEALRAPELYRVAPVELPAPDPTRFFLVVNDVPTQSSVPRLFHEGAPAIALRPVAEQLFTTVIDMGQGEYELVTPEGQRRKVTALMVSGIPTLTEPEMEELFAVEMEIDTTRGILALHRPTPVQVFESYASEKTSEQLAEEVREAESKKKVPRANQDTEFIPEAARPSVDLVWRSAYTYVNPHPAPSMLRSWGNSLTGRFYDYQLDFSTLRKDKNGIFDHDYTAMTLSKPGFQLRAFDQSIALDPLRLQSDGFSGARIDQTFELPSERSHLLTVALGETGDTASGPSASTKYLGNLYVLRDEFKVSKMLTWDTALLHLDRGAEVPNRAGTTPFPRDVTLGMTGARLNLPHDIEWDTHLALSRQHPDDNPDEPLDDKDWRTSLLWQGDRSSMGWDYEFVGDQYASLGDPVNYQDYAGWRWYGDTQLTDRWSMGASLLRSQDNVEQNPSVVTTENQNFSLSSGYQVTDRQTLALSYSNFLSKPHGGANASPSSRSTLYRADYFFPFFYDSRMLANYQYYRTDVQTSTDTYAHSTGLSLFKWYGRGSSFNISESLTTSFPEASEDSIDLTTSFDWTHYLTDRLSVYTQSSYARNETDGARTTGTATARAGIRTQLKTDTELNMEYAIGSYDLKAENRQWPRNWSVLFMVSQAVPVRTSPNFGTISGRFFEDLNGNNRQDAGEPGGGDVLIRLDDAEEAITNERGDFKFTRVVPGRHHVDIDLSNLDPMWTTREPKRSLEVLKRRTVALTFPLVKSATLMGRVFIDANGDRQYQETEEPLEGIAVLLLPGDQVRRTNSDGIFWFEGIYPGEYSLLLHHADIPKGYVLVSPDAQSVLLVGGEETQAGDFAVRLLHQGAGD